MQADTGTFWNTSAMQRPDGIELRQGCACWMRVALPVVSLLAAWAILTAAAPPQARAGLLAALLGWHVATARQMRRAAGRVPRIRLFDNGTAALLLQAGAVPATLVGRPWTSRWFSVFQLQPLDGGRRVYCTVCRSLNRGGAYRRLRVLLRMRTGREQSVHWGWS